MIDQQQFLAKAGQFHLPSAYIKLAIHWDRNKVEEWDGGVPDRFPVAEVRLEIEIIVYGPGAIETTALSFSGETRGGDYTRPLAFLNFCQTQLVAED